MKARKAPTKKATITMPLTARMDLYTKMARAKIFPSFGLKAAHALRACSRKVTFGLTTPGGIQSAPGTRRAKAPGPRAASRSRYALDPAVIAAGKLPDKAPVVTSAANPH